MITRSEIETTITEVERLQNKISTQCREMVDIVDEKIDEIKTMLKYSGVDEEFFDIMEELMFKREWLWNRLGP